MTLTEAAQLCQNALGGQHEPCDVDDINAAVLLMAAHVLDETNELADHKQRLAAQSARLAAAESEVRRLRRVIDAAETRHAVQHPAGVCIGLHRDSLAAADSAEACGGVVVECKVVPVRELEVSDD